VCVPAQELCQLIAGSMTDRTIGDVIHLPPPSIAGNSVDASQARVLQECQRPFQLGKMHGAFMDTCNALCGLRYDVIKMPSNATEMCSVADGFCTKTSFSLSLERSTGRT